MANFLEGEKVLITGVGSIGNHLIERLQQEGVGQIHVLTRSIQKAEDFRKRGLIPFIGQITDESLLLQASRNCSTIFHLAAWMGLSLQSQEAEQINVEGTRRVVDTAKEVGIRKFVNLSTIAVYGNQDGRIDEHSPLKAQSAYGRTKAFAEGVIVSSDLDYTILRPGMLMGPHVDVWTKRIYHSLQNTFLGWRGIPPLIIGDEGGSFNMCYIEDLIEVMVKSVSAPEASKEIFNVAGDYGLFWEDVIHYYEQEMKVKASTFPKSIAKLAGFLGNAIPNSPVNSDTVNSATNLSLMDNRKVKAYLGINFTSFDEVMEKTMEWVRRDCPSRY